MKYRTSTEIRQLFLDYFVSKGHVIEPSSPLVPKDDPTLLWINSGVAALKKYFDGSVIPASRRITNAQKSLRANDIENVGVTARHHTFFEMLGNFSIGDYFRPEAIAYGWELLTSDEWFGFEPEKLYVTVYPTDTETYTIWKDVIGLPEDHIVLCEDNFWEIGEGPCGPCTEIFYDRGESFNFDTPAEELVVAGENDRYVEIWNIVFSQYNAKEGLDRSEYDELPAKNIDTGMGLERMVSIIQDGKTNFETDLFLPIIHKIESLANVKYDEATTEQQTAYKLIADHLRAVAFGIADGALPSNEGRGYVIRRLLRRASRYAKKLGIHTAFLYELVPVIVEIMQGYYGYLIEKQELIQRIIKIEEQKFLATLADGEKKLEDFLAATVGTELAGEDAFMLYDTYGFPIELTREIVAETGYTVDETAFAEQMNAQKERARAARNVTESMHTQNELLQEFKTSSTFLGYEELVATMKPILIAQGDTAVTELVAGDEAMIIFDQTPFYAESGGQVADKGTITNEHGQLIVQNVKKAPNGQNLHYVTVTSGNITLDDIFTGTVDVVARKATERNHTATHLLQHVLRKELGTHIEQSGSYVDSERLRFDFTHFEALSQTQIDSIERQINELIWAALPLTTNVMAIDEAKKLGAMALFGEKYGDVVRVVQVGNSIELCGGTHIKNSAEIGIFKIISESGIGSGVRRIEAMTSKHVYEYLTQEEAIVATTQTLLKKKQKQDILPSIELLMKENKQLGVELKQVHKLAATSTVVTAMEQPELIKANAFAIAEFTGATMKELKEYTDILKERYPEYLAVFYSVESDKTNIVVATSKSQLSVLKSNDIVKKINEKMQSRGGGKPELAQTMLNQSISRTDLVALLSDIL